MKKFIYFTLLPSLLLFSACGEFLDVNDNPNSPTNVPLEQRLPNALVKSVVLESGSLNQLGAVWAGYWAKATDGPGASSLFRLEETYGVEAMSFDRDGRPIWEDSYTVLVNYKDIEISAQTSGDLAYSGIAKIMQAWHFLRLVDLYNNVPFSEALQGVKNSTPSYEDGETVYRESIDLITEGINEIKEAPALSQKPAADDVMFKGNLELWVKFGNTVKLRALLRRSELGDNDYISQEIAKIVQEGSGYLSIGESALVNPGFIATASKQNPFWDTYYRTPTGSATSGFNTLRPTEYIIQQYQSLNDPRVETLYAKPETGDDYKGVPLGMTANTGYTRKETSALLGPEENNGQPAALLKSAEQPAVLMGSFESLFLQAEAAQRGWIMDDAATLYELAISESFEYMEVEDHLFQDYYQQEAVLLSGTDQPLQRIIEQKWLALNSINSIEAWNDYRRLEIPTDLPVSLQSPSQDPNYRPQRLTYRQSELSSNGAEVAKQGHIDPFISRVFWDVK